MYTNLERSFPFHMNVFKRKDGEIDVTDFRTLLIYICSRGSTKNFASFMRAFDTSFKLQILIQDKRFMKFRTKCLRYSLARTEKSFDYQTDTYAKRNRPTNSIIYFPIFIRHNLYSPSLLKRLQHGRI